MAIDSIEIRTPRGTFTARAAGTPAAPLVLCLHGFPDDATTFDVLLERLAAAGLRAVAPYCRGYAPSPLANPDGSRFGKDLFAVLAADVLAIADALAPAAPVRIVGHDNGAFTVYHTLNRAPERFVRAVTLSAAHPAVVYKNTSRSPRQLWRSRYAIFLQLPGFSEATVHRDNYAYTSSSCGGAGQCRAGRCLGGILPTSSTRWRAACRRPCCTTGRARSTPAVDGGRSLCSPYI